jgi:hypothetical protein
MLGFPQMDVRRQTVRDAHTGTCAWILEQPEYKCWCDTKQTSVHRGFLWIKSKPGAGKSTLMKYLLESTEQRSPDEAVISFFFNARGDFMERSLEGMYRQLLHQLLTRVVPLQSVVPASGLSRLEPLDLTRQVLENLFKKSVLGLGGHERVICFIDALDECPESEIRDLVEFFEDLGEFTATKGIRFRVCFSSRHYPNVSLEKCQHLMLDGQSGHQRDIATYVGSKLRLSKSKKNEEIKAAVQKRAQGVFLWVVLVVKRLNRDYDHGNVHSLRSRLEEIPDGLDALFRDTLELTSDKDGMTTQMMQWMMYALEPLSREELYFGVHTGALSEGVPEPWDRDEVTPEVMDRFIINCSRGLVELTRGRHPTTQFIHESVRDYLFGDGLELIAPERSKNLAGASHDYLKRSCLKLITSSTIGDASCVELLLESSHGKTQSEAGRDARRLFPLLVYAWKSVVGHARTASQCGIDQGEFVSSFPFHIWNQVGKLLGARSRHSKTEVFLDGGANYHLLACELLKYELRPGYPLMAPLEHAHLIHHELTTEPTDVEHEILELILQRGVASKISWDDQASLIRCAMRHHCTLSLEILFENGIRIHTDKSFRQLLSQALIDRRAATAQILLDYETKFGPFTTDVLHIAINCNSVATLKVLLASGAEANASTGTMDGAAPPQMACADGPRKSFHEAQECYICEEIMEAFDNSDAEREHDYLAQHSDDEDYKIAEHLTALQYAALIGREEIVRLLLEHEAHQCATPAERYAFAMPLYLAALLNHHAIVLHLLQHSSWSAAPDSTVWRRSLSAAALNGHFETVKVLLITDHTGVQAQESSPSFYEQVLDDTIDRDHEKTLGILIDFLDALPQFYLEWDADVQYYNVMKV